MTVPSNNLTRLNKIIDRLWLVFKIGLPVSVGVLVVGTVVGGLLCPEKTREDVPPGISAAGEIGVALAAGALALAQILEGYVYVRSSRRSLSLKIRGLLGNFLSVVLLTAVTVVMIVLASHDLHR